MIQNSPILYSREAVAITLKFLNKIEVRSNPWFHACFKFLICITYSPLSCKLVTSFPTSNIIKIFREEPVLRSFYCKVAACNSLSEITRSTLSKKRLLSQYIDTNVPKNISLLSCRATPDATLVLKKVKTCSRWCHSQIIAVSELTPDIFFINKCSSLHQNNSDYSGGLN